MGERTPAPAALLDQLLALPQEEFVGARDALAAELRARGEKLLAASVKQLRRPPVSIWALDQAVREAPQAVQALLDGGAAMRRALEGGDPGRYRDASAQFQVALNRIADGAIRALAGKHASTADVRRRIERTIHAAALGAEDHRDALRRGHLLDELEPLGFEALPTGMPAADRTPAPPDEEPRRPTRPSPMPATDRRAAQERERERQRRIDAARREVDQLRHQVERLQRLADEQRRTAEAARRRFEEALRQADEADQSAAQARARLAEAEQQLAEAEAKR